MPLVLPRNVCAEFAASKSLPMSQPPGPQPVWPQAEQQAKHAWMQAPPPVWGMPRGHSHSEPWLLSQTHDMNTGFPATFEGLSLGPAVKGRAPFRPKQGTPAATHTVGPTLAHNTSVRSGMSCSSSSSLGAFPAQTLSSTRTQQHSTASGGPLEVVPSDLAAYPPSLGIRRGQVRGSVPHPDQPGWHSGPAVSHPAASVQPPVPLWQPPDPKSLEGKLLQVVPDVARHTASQSTALAPFPPRPARTLNRLLSWPQAPPGSPGGGASVASDTSKVRSLHTSSHPEWCSATGEALPSPCTGTSSIGGLQTPAATSSSPGSPLETEAAAALGKTIPPPMLPLMCLLPWVKPVATLLRKGGLVITLSNVKEDRAWGELPVPQLSCDCMPETVKSLPVEGITRAMMHKNRASLPEPWQSPKEWEGDQTVMLAGDFHGVLLICSCQGRTILPSLQSVLLLCAHVRFGQLRTLQREILM
jgi:hypothetical protein